MDYFNSMWQRWANSQTLQANITARIGKNRVTLTCICMTLISALHSYPQLGPLQSSGPRCIGTYMIELRCSVLWVSPYTYRYNRTRRFRCHLAKNQKGHYVKRPTTFGQFSKRPKTKKANGKKANKTKRPLEQYKP